MPLTISHEEGETHLLLRHEQSRWSIAVQGSGTGEMPHVMFPEAQGSSQLILLSSVAGPKSFMPVRAKMKMAVSVELPT